METSSTRVSSTSESSTTDSFRSAIRHLHMFVIQPGPSGGCDPRHRQYGIECRKGTRVPRLLQVMNFLPCASRRAGRACRSPLRARQVGASTRPTRCRPAHRPRSPRRAVGCSRVRPPHSPVAPTRLLGDMEAGGSVSATRAASMSAASKSASHASTRWAGVRCPFSAAALGSRV